MTPITTIRARLPCPTCGVVGLRTLAVPRPSPSTSLLDARDPDRPSAGHQRGRISECADCWSRRASLIASARRRLRETGRLSALLPGRGEAWLGVPISRCEEDFENAFASELMRAAGGAPLPPSARHQVVVLDPQERGEKVTEEEPVEV